MSKLVKMIVLVAVAIATVASVAHSAPGRSNCRLTDKIPVSPSDQPELRGSKDNSALASFLGYIQYNSTGAYPATGYMALRLQTVEPYLSKDGLSTELVYLHTDCASLAFRLSEINGDYTVAWIRFEVPESGFDTGYPIAFSPDISIPSGHYYSCEEGNYSAVWPSLKTTVTLHIRDLKLELDRDPKSAKSGMFSKKEHKCSA